MAAFPERASIVEEIRCTAPPHQWRAPVWPWDWQSLTVKKRWCWWCLWREVPELLWGWGELVGDYPWVPGMDRVDSSCCIPQFWVRSSVKEADLDRWLEYNRWVLFQLVESAGSWCRWVTSSMNRHSSMMRVIMEVLLLSQELVDMGNGAHTSQSWTGETHSWRSLETQTME